MGRTGSIKGVVRDTHNRPLEDAAVMIVQGPTHNDLAALTGADGSFAFPGLRPGRYTIQARAAMRSSNRIPLTVRSAKVVFVEVWLEEDLIEERAGEEPEDMRARPEPRGSGREPEDFVDEL